MGNSEGGPGDDARLRGAGHRFNLASRGLLLAAILIVGFLTSYRFLGGSAADGAVAQARHEPAFRSDAATTVAPPAIPRQAMQSTARAEDGLRRGGATFIIEDAQAYVYTVRMGEYWSLIADRFGASEEILKAANPPLWQLRGEALLPGDQMAIPGFDARDMVPPTLYTVQEGDSWQTLAERFSRSYLDLLLDNFELWARRGAEIAAGDSLRMTHLPAAIAAAQRSSFALSPSGGANEAASAANADPPGTYEVKAGDTWESVAAETGVALFALKDVNAAFKERELRPGDVVRFSWILHAALTLRKAERGGVRSQSDIARLSPEETAALVDRGREVYKEQYCGICHQLASAATRGLFGPSHDGLAALVAARIDDPSYSGAATDVYSYLYESIIEPDIYYVEGFAPGPHRMPSYRHVPETDLEALIVFLAEQ